MLTELIIRDCFQIINFFKQINSFSRTKLNNYQSNKNIYAKTNFKSNLPASHDYFEAMKIVDAAASPKVSGSEVQCSVR